MPQTKKLTLRERLALYDRGKKPAEKPEKPTAMRQAARNLDIINDPNIPPEKKPYLPGTFEARADSIAAGAKARPSAAKPKPTLKERIASVNERMDKQRTRLDAIRNKLKRNEELYAGEQGKITEKSLRDWKRRLAEGTIKYDRDNRLLVKLMQEQTGAKPSKGRYTEKSGPPTPAGVGQPGEPALADIDVSMRGEGTVIHDKLTDKYYKVIDGKLVPLIRSEPKGF